MKEPNQTPTLADLISSLEAAPKGNWHLNYAIMIALGMKDAPERCVLEQYALAVAGKRESGFANMDPDYGPCGDEEHYRDFTGSLDAALSLVPEDWFLEHLGQLPGEWHAKVANKIDDRLLFDEAAKTGPLALCIAALKARAS